MDHSPSRSHAGLPMVVALLLAACNNGSGKSAQNPVAGTDSQAIPARNMSHDGQGGFVRSYSAVATVWAAVLPASMRHQLDADDDGAVVRLRLILRSGFALTLRHQFNDAGKIYRITALREVDERRFVEIDAEWRID